MLKWKIGRRGRKYFYWFAMSEHWVWIEHTNCTFNWGVRVLRILQQLGLVWSISLGYFGSYVMFDNFGDVVGKWSKVIDWSLDPTVFWPATQNLHAEGHLSDLIRAFLGKCVACRSLYWSGHAPTLYVWKSVVLSIYMILWYFWPIFWFFSINTFESQ